MDAELYLNTDSVKHTLCHSDAYLNQERRQMYQYTNMCQLGPNIQNKIPASLMAGGHRTPNEVHCSMAPGHQAQGDFILYINWQTMVDLH